MRETKLAVGGAVAGPTPGVAGLGGGALVAVGGGGGSADMSGQEGKGTRGTAELTFLPSVQSLPARWDTLLQLSNSVPEMAGKLTVPCSLSYSSH